MKRILLLFCILSLASINSWATTFTWTGGGGDNNWETDANWDVGLSYPQLSGDIVIFNAGSVDCIVNSDISLGSGTFTINGYSGIISWSGDYTFSCGAVTVTTGMLDFSGSGSPVNTTAIIVNGGTFIACAGTSFNGSGVFSLSSGTADFSASSSATLSGLSISGGTFESSSIECRGNATLSGSGVFNHNNGTFTIRTSAQNSTTYTITGNFVFHTLQLLLNGTTGNANPSKTINLANDITVQHDLKFSTSGTLNNKTLTLGTSSYIINLTDDGSTGAGVSVTASGGSITAINCNPTLNFNSTLAQTVSFYPTQNLKYGDLKFNNIHTNGVSLGAAVTSTNVTGNMILETGTFTNNSSSGYAIAGNAGKVFQVNSGATIKLYATSAFPTGFGTMALNSGSTVEYAGTTQTISGVPTYHHLVLSSSSGSVTKTLGAATAINGNLSINANATLDAAGFQLTLAGNFANSGSFSSNGNTTVFDGNTTISGSATTTLGGVTINSTKTLVAPAGTLNIAGNFANDGAFTHSSGSIAFTGTTTISGSSTSAFNNVTISGTLTGHSGTMNVAGNFANNGTFTHNSGTILFNGTTIISGSSTTTFSGINITGTLTAPTAMNVAGDFANSGTFTHNSGTVTFTGTTTVSGSSTTTFNNVTISGTLTGHSGTMNVASNFANNGTYTHNSGTVVFTGTTIVSGSSTTSFSGVTITGTLTAPGTMNVAGNFANNGTFTHNSGTVTFTGTTTVSGSSATTFNNVTISGTLTGHSGTTSIVGTYTNNGTFVNNTGTIAFIGSSAQAIAGSSTSAFANLTINNTSGVSLSSTTVTISDVLTVSNGTFAAAGNSITLLSTSSKTARIAPVTGTGAFSGDFTIQREIAARATLTWANLSSPVASTNVQDWDDELFFYYPHTPPTGVSNILIYDETISDYTGVTAATTITPGLGFEIWFADEAAVTTFTGATLNTTGTPNYGTQNIGLNYTAANAPYDGENLIGNPFASAIQVNLMNPTNASATVDVYQNPAGTYLTLSGTDLIAPHQGFWAYATSNGASMSIPETAKASSLTEDVRSLEVKPYLQLMLSSADGSHEMYHVLKVVADENASDGWDLKDHPFKSSPNKAAPFITANSEKRPLSISTFNSNHQEYVMPLNTGVGIAGKYKISTTGIEFVNKDFTCVSLEDKVLGKAIDLNAVDNYIFLATPADAKNRFALHFSKEGSCRLNSSVGGTYALDNVVQILQTATGATINFNLDNTSHALISVVDVLGQTIIDSKSVEVSTQTLKMDLPAEFHGIYLVKITSENKSVVKKFVKP